MDGIVSSKIWLKLSYPIMHCDKRHPLPAFTSFTLVMLVPTFDRLIWASDKNCCATLQHIPHAITNAFVMILFYFLLFLFFYFHVFYIILFFAVKHF